MNKPLRPLRGRLLAEGRTGGGDRFAVLTPANLLPSLRDEKAATKLRGQGGSQVQLGNEGRMRLRRPALSQRRPPTAPSRWNEGAEAHRAIQPLQGWVFYRGNTQGRRWSANPSLYASILSGLAEGRCCARRLFGNEGAML